MKEVFKKPTKKQIADKLKVSVQALNELVKIRLAQSEVHGIGVFAMRDLKKGEVLSADIIPQGFDLPYKDFKKLRPEVAELILERWPLIATGSSFIYPDTRYQAFMNHSDKPNYDGKTDKLLKAVKKGEEIFEDYRTIEGYKKVYKWLK